MDKTPPASDSPRRPRSTLRRRLLFFLLVPLVALLLVSLTADYQVAYSPAQEAYDHALADDAVELASRVRVEGKAILVDLPAAAEDVLRSDSVDQEFIAVYGPDGRLLAGDADLKADADFHGRNPFLSDSTLRNHRIRKVSYRLETPAGLVTVAVAETVRKRQRTGSKILAAMVLPNILLVVATLLLVFFGIRTGLAPLTHLSEEIVKRKPHDLSPLPQTEVPLEAEPLVAAMDGLIADLRTAASAQQAFLANAAHQLKTPLAGLQTQLELAAAELPEQYRHRVVHLGEATQRLGHLAHQLLALARSGPEANVTHESRRVDLARLLESNASAWFDAALAKDIDLGFEPEPAVIQGSEWLLRELLANLIGNAIQYTPRGGMVTARSGHGEDGRPFVEVEDTGPGIPAAERNRVFDRFYRGEGAAGTGTGTGLGLAIVKEVADRHGATIAIADAGPAGGARIRVSFAPES
ncbi:MAG TPA: sensor histidine kinase [Rhodocyclaceae bacterium]|nr:sensor histidine kinase [Rhodocyclaceae bacterium]